jgi:ankyrin repeat protein
LHEASRVTVGVRLLLDYAASPLVENKAGDTPLRVACRVGDTPTFKELFGSIVASDRGAVIDSRNQAS